MPSIPPARGSNPLLRRLALSRWDGEGGAIPSRPMDGATAPQPADIRPWLDLAWHGRTPAAKAPKR